MKTDKGLIRQHNETWAEKAYSNLSSLNIPVLISANKLQTSTYSKLFPMHKLIVDDENLFVNGPLLGLWSVHQTIPAQDLFVLACDMVDMNKEPLEHLLKVYASDIHEACIYNAGGVPQPLCGIYTSDGLKRILSLHKQDQLKKFSMMHVLECLDTHYIFNPVFDKYFTNYNSVEDLRKRNSIS